MYPDWVGSAVAGFLAVWLVVLSFLVWRQSQFLNVLFPRSGSRDIRKKFVDIIELVEGFKGDLSDLSSQVQALRNQGLEYIQKVELLRFNPYDDTGGDQSFVVCFLDSQGSGIVITSLHARSGTRVFAKNIVSGKSSKYQLSKEEEQVIKKVIEK